jgi:hypothetical protein
MAKRSTIQASGQAMIYNFLLNEVLASQIQENYEFWVVAPWVTNFRLEQPFHVSFQEIIDTKQEYLSLFDILYQIAANGGHVYITVGDYPDYYSPIKALSQRNRLIQVRVLPGLHTKAYVGQYGGLDGSLNLTNGGVNQNVELFTYSYDERHIAELRKICVEHFEHQEAVKLV